MKVVLASSNVGKCREFQAILSSYAIELILQETLSVSEIEETGMTFVENAIIKARHASKITGLPAIADDSGLAVAALQGAPGIYSARYAKDSEENNIQKLLRELKAIPTEKRDAFFHCTIVYLAHEKDPTPFICQGTWHGVIAESPRGEGGFGYDPVFYIPSLNKTAAELSAAEKNKISHRAIALQKLAKEFKTNEL